MRNENRNIHCGKLRNMASVYLRKNNQLLLLYRQGNSIVSNLWIGSAGGHFEEKETNDAKACAMRELFEELSISEQSLSNLTLRYITLRYTDGEIRQNYYFFADYNGSNDCAPISTEGICRWFKIAELTNLPMPITARQMIDHYVQTGQYDDQLYVGVSNQEHINFIHL